MKPLQQLQELAYQHKQEQHPDIPAYAIPKPKYSDRSANELTKAIIDLIKFSGGWATRINVMGTYRQSKEPGIIGGRYTKSTTEKGTSDIHAVYKGLHLSIEIKINSDKQSPDQKKVQEKVEAAGGVYYIARNFSDFYTWFTEEIKKPREGGAMLNRTFKTSKIQHEQR